MPVETGNQERRHTAIRRILSEQSVHRQSELVRLLREQGIRATQSSVSRDLRQLGVVKLASGYQEPEAGEALAPLLPPEEFLRSIEVAGPHLTVIRTAVGAAARVAVYLDRSGWAEIVGTVSGDDTIFVATQARRNSEPCSPGYADSSTFELRRSRAT